MPRLAKELITLGVSLGGVLPPRPHVVSSAKLSVQDSGTYGSSENHGTRGPRTNYPSVSFLEGIVHQDVELSALGVLLGAVTEDEIRQFGVC